MPELPAGQGRVARRWVRQARWGPCRPSSRPAVAAHARVCGTPTGYGDDSCRGDSGEILLRFNSLFHLYLRRAQYLAGLRARSSRIPVHRISTANETDGSPSASSQKSKKFLTKITPDTSVSQGIFIGEQMRRESAAFPSPAATPTPCWDPALPPGRRTRCRRLLDPRQRCRDRPGRRRPAARRRGVVVPRLGQVAGDITVRRP